MTRQVVVVLVFTMSGLVVQSACGELRILPPELQLVGPRAQQRLLVARVFPDGSQVDLTAAVIYDSFDPAVATVNAAGVVRPQQAGRTKIVVRAGNEEVTVPVSVHDLDRMQPIDFRSEVLPALSRGGCSQGACHGSPQGKNGFRLSLRGFDPTLDLLTLTREHAGRRLDRLVPDRSLVLLKASARVAHGGGLRLRPDEPAYELLRDWIASGHDTRETASSLVRLEVLPQHARLHTSSRRQQIIARAHFDDGTVKDVTDLSVFTTADDQAVEVSPGGLVHFHRTAEAAILVRYLDRIETVRLNYVDVDPKFHFTAPPAVNYIDRFVFSKQRELQLRPAKVTDDATFLRRVYLDLIGSIPTASEARRFLTSNEPSRRQQLIDELLERDEFAQFWALKWADVMRGSRETISHRGVHNFHRYLVRNFDADRPFDEVAREILTSLGNTIHKPAANFFRVSRNPTEAAESFSQLFLGVRIQCAKCHNHPYESITQRDYYGLAAAFARVQIKGTRFGLDDEVVLNSEG